MEEKSRRVVSLVTSSERSTLQTQKKSSLKRMSAELISAGKNEPTLSPDSLPSELSERISLASLLLPLLILQGRLKISPHSPLGLLLVLITEMFARSLSLDTPSEIQKRLRLLNPPPAGRKPSSS